MARGRQLLGWIEVAAIATVTLASLATSAALIWRAIVAIVR